MDGIDSITVRDYRCFANSQTSRLAPLTLLVGDNNTGKTSLMAMLRAMSHIACADRVPDFKEPPYDLGTFDEIVHRSGARGGPPDRFGATLEIAAQTKDGNTGAVVIDVDFADYQSAPVPVRRHVSQGECWIEQRIRDTTGTHTSYGTPRGAWEHVQADSYRSSFVGHTNTLPPIEVVLWLLRHVKIGHEAESSPEQTFEPIGGSPPISSDDLAQIKENLEYARMGAQRTDGAGIRGVFASAPVRSQPRRTYDPARATLEPEGDYVPMYLAQLALRQPERWDWLKGRLQEFGNQAGLFTEIEVHRLGKIESAPFQIRIRKSGKRRKGPFRNLVDMGCGLSQALPIITELLRHDGPRLMLLQQPEAHLHPGAAAALASLFCETVANSEHGRQIVVETHSDFIIDRVRTSVRDRAAGIQPEDVSILYFERNEQAVNIHSISVDRLGNIDGAPVGYRRFFMDELRRSMSA